MVWQVVNVPPKGGNVGIECKPTEHGDYRVQTSDGWEICTICGTSPESIASGIASAIRMVCDVGFEQGREHVRAALGIK